MTLEPQTEAPTERGLEPERVLLPRLALTLLPAGGGEPERRVIDAEVVRIGSHPGNDLAILDDLVSKFHCRLELREGRWCVRDEASRNGTFLDGVRVRDADLGVPTSELRVGRTKVRVSPLTSEARETVPPTPGLGRIAGQSVVMRRLFQRIVKIAAAPLDVLIEGESGTGKELVAWEIVQNSRRARAPLVVLDCGAVSPNLFESELFGHARGAFTGAHRDREGAFEAADGGTLFLDEIGELPLELQAKLLRALAQREVRRVGETTSRRVDVRVIAATHRPLEREVNAGRFREDLFHRLAVARVQVPPLRDRQEDLRLLVDIFVGELGAEGKRASFEPALAGLARHDWPGNVRELRNFVERMVLFDGDEEPSPTPSERASDHEAAAPTVLAFGAAKRQAVVDFERHYLAGLIAATRGNVSEAARRAQVDRMHLHRLLQAHGLRGKRAAP